MGIIFDFLTVNNNIDLYVKDKNFSLFKPFKIRKMKKKLADNILKISNANLPMEKDQVLELAQYLHGDSLGYNFISENYSIKYYPFPNIYELILNKNNFPDTNINYFKIMVSNDNSQMEIEFEIINQNNITHVNRINLEKFYTNIKELEEYINICNSALYKVTQDYIYANIR